MAFDSHARRPPRKPAARTGRESRSIAARSARTGFRRAAGIVWLAAVWLIVPPSSAQNRDSTGPAGTLTPADKTELAEIFRLKADVGDRVWPGFAKCGIPVLLYNDDFEFLIGSADPPSPWVKVPDDDSAGAPYHRRPRGRVQAFAIEVGGTWAGSISTLGRMNAKAPFKLPPDFHVVLALHEMFHAFQASQAPERFARALKVYAAEDRYPFKDKEFAAAWTSEGAALAKGIQAADDVAAAAAAREFLKTRDERRTKAALAPDLLGFERELEWLEGLAKYAEIGFYEIAANLPPGPTVFRYAVPMLFIQSDYMRLGNGLGAQSGDLRFYLSGMAQARLLDRLSPGWKDKALPGPASLEDLIREAVLPGRKKSLQSGSLTL